MNTDPGSASSSGVRGALRRLGATAVGVLQTRLALAGVELEEELQRLGRLLAQGLGLLMTGLMAMLTFSLWLVLVFPPEQRLQVLGALVVGYTLCALWFVWRIRIALSARPPLLGATLTELARDRDALTRGLSDGTGVGPDRPASAAPSEGGHSS